MTLLGHDVSEYQAVGSFSGAFTIVKLTEAHTYIDPLASGHITRALIDGKLIGGYHFAAVGDPVGQAKHFAGQIPKHRPFLPFVDVEGSAAAAHNAPPAFTLAFLRQLEHETQLVGGVYINFSTWKAFDWSSVSHAGYHLWLADWDSVMPATPGWDPILWQNGDGHGQLDGDVFLGDAAAWESYGTPKGRRAPAPSQAPTRAPATSYVVQPGDTLSGIAAHFHTTAGHLAQLNKLPNPNLILVGQRLVISGPALRSAQAFDTIRSGDTLSSIAARNHTTVSRLVQLNGIANPNLIYANRKLRVK